jgi:hypothetical protein
MGGYEIAVRVFHNGLEGWRSDPKDIEDVLDWLAVEDYHIWENAQNEQRNIYVKDFNP